MRLEEMLSYGPKIIDRINTLILRLTADETRSSLAGAKWPDVLKTPLPDLVEIEVDDDLLNRLDEDPTPFP